MRPNMRPMEKTDLKGALNDLSTYMRKSLGVVVLALVLAALSAVLTIIGPDHCESRHSACCHLRTERALRLYPALYYGERHAQNVLPHTRGIIRKD